eukprot:304142-Amphidinium_carterae.1
MPNKHTFDTTTQCVTKMSRFLAEELTKSKERKSTKEVIGQRSTLHMLKDSNGSDEKSCSLVTKSAVLCKGKPATAFTCAP